MTDDELREAYQHAVAARGAGRRPADCPPPDALESLVRRDGPESARLRTLDHVMTCAACRSEFELLRSIEAARRRDAPASPALEWSRRGWRRPLALALAASVMFAIVLGPGRSVWSDWRSDTVRGETRAIALVAPSGGATVADSVRFVWRPADGAGSYVLELMTADGTIRHSVTTRDTAIVVNEVTSLEPGDYRWWVRTAMPGGELRSELQVITVRAR